MRPGFDYHPLKNEKEKPKQSSPAFSTITPAKPNISFGKFNGSDTFYEQELNMSPELIHQQMLNTNSTLVIASDPPSPID